MNVVERYGLTETINVSGTMTAIGASSVKPEIIAAMVDILPRFVRIDELQARASEVIHRVIGAEAGCVTASAASGITVAIAACMAGNDLAMAERLPDTTEMRNEVVIQRGHMVWYGASVGQLARLAGAKLVEIGDATRAGSYQLAGAINEHTAAAVYVTSHHTVPYGMIDLPTFCRVAHEHGVPVVVDAASESAMHTFFEAGADIVCFSGHKFLAGPTSGIIAGRRDLVRACLVHQHAGIGRPMKVGKEGIVGVIAALERWESLDHEAVQRHEADVVRTFMSCLTDLPGLDVRTESDPTGNPIVRVRVTVDASIAGLNAFHLAAAMRRNDPPIFVRDHHAIDQGVIFLDPCNVTIEQARYVAGRLGDVLHMPEGKKAQLRTELPDTPNGADLEEEGLRAWLKDTGPDDA